MTEVTRSLQPVQLPRLCTVFFPQVSIDKGCVSQKSPGYCGRLEWLDMQVGQRKEYEGQADWKTIRFVAYFRILQKIRSKQCHDEKLKMRENF